MVMVSLLDAHTPLLIVHTKVFTPRCNTASLAESLGDSIAVPLVILLHNPIPIVGVFPVNITVSEHTL